MTGFNVFGWDVKTEYTKTLAEYVEKMRYEDIPAEVLERFKIFLTHAIGCALAASKMKSTEIAVTVAKEIGSSGDATCWVTGEKMTTSAACFANGAALDMLDWEDCAYTGHPLYGIIPPAIAIGEQKKASGKELLTAMVAAFEAYQRIALCVGDPGKIPHPKFGHGLPNWSIFGATAAAAKLYELSADQINQAFGATAMIHPINSSGVQATMSEAYHLEAGYIAQGGLWAALCAREGIDNMRDAFDIPYMFSEQLTKDPQFHWLNKELGSRYMLMEMLLKHWPANMWVQNPIEAAWLINKEHNLDTDQIKEIIVDPPMEFRMHHRPEGYTSVLDAEFSTPYGVAIVLLHPVPGADWYTKEMFKDPKVLELAAKVKAGPSAALSLLGSFDVYASSNGTDFPTRTVTIEMNDGTIYTKEVKFPKGHPMNMLTKEEIHELFMHQSQKCLTAEKAEGLFSFIWNLENETDVSEIAKFFQA